ncbi:uncharacterized protein LOC122844761 [Gambusia affinis]|uniref:uncharacterized protein LOC122844761 n=1 Tax=Gambusia affinis TaxID=33528 RepID=UPI001CDC43DA|nr:uncharacterized protein LOC122844761 [Gambusia affinis]XP_043996447.1 uncharacterized protein LOC122844761 [Gambusia affinis]
MILTAPSPCLPSAATVQQLFSVARDADIIPDISLDPVLTTFLSLDSAAALQHRYSFLQRGMSGEQQEAFHLNLTAQLSGYRVANGGVGVVALALSLLFDQVAQHVRAAASPQGSEVPRVFGISTSSRIGSMIHGYLRLVPAIANDEEKMAEAAELYDAWLNLELIDHYERMTTKKRMSTEAMRQWLAGAAFHLHLRIHQVRLHSVPSGSIESLRLSYKTGLRRLVSGYVAYLRKNILETEAGGTLEPKRGSVENSNASSIGNVTAHPADAKTNSTAGDQRSCGQLVGRNASAAPCFSQPGLLVIEPQREVGHGVRHRPCESAAIQEALVTRIMKAQDLQRNRNFFLYPEKVLRGLLRQKQHFELRANRAERNDPSGSQPQSVSPTFHSENNKLQIMDT